MSRRPHDFRGAFPGCSLEFARGAPIGTIKTPNTPFTTTVTPQVYGDSHDEWGATLTPGIVTDPSFGFAMAVNLPDTSRLFIGMPWQMTVTYSFMGSSYTITASPGSITAQTGYIYGQTFTSIYGHESSMSALSASTGIFTNMDVRTNVLSSTDSQVNGINLYRTTDGGDADPAFDAARGLICLTWMPPLSIPRLISIP